ncbi:MAG TPA: serine/threonine-protein kinase, partial [Gemmatimonadaceae bacterium]
MGVMDRDHWRVLEPLLDHALELSVEARASWLDALRDESPALAGELATLLSGEEAADQRGFLNVPLGVRPEGMEIGAYTLERALGQGGMGSVWLARRTDGRFEGFAAVKLLNLALLGPAGQARFRREGSVLARLTHPGIARLMDAGVCASGQPYLVLEYVDGEPIDRYADAHHLPLDARVRLVLDVLAAVGHAHANLIVHRDLKPSNILVTRDGVVKLLDFGIAKLLRDDLAEGRSALTAESAHLMTPEFAAPEQVSGGTITTATDVYACGVLLYLLA